MKVVVLEQVLNNLNNFHGLLHHESLYNCWEQNCGQNYSLKCKSTSTHKKYKAHFYFQLQF